MRLESLYNNNTLIIEMDMKELIERLEQKTAELFRDARSQLDKGNKTAGLRARRTSLEMEPLLKQLRKMSLEIANDRRKY
ncbi:histone H1 [Phocaeicola sartorii]|uniref:histone H1 n=2 Tax=Bacteroidaceae TaxID=815 RepID=UPI00389A62DA